MKKLITFSTALLFLLGQITQPLFARNYDPIIGKFTSVDPFMTELTSEQKEHYKRFLYDPQKGNPYSYVLNNPIVYVDPSGQFEVHKINRWNGDGGTTPIVQVSFQMSNPVKTTISVVYPLAGSAFALDNLSRLSGSENASEKTIRNARNSLIEAAAVDSVGLTSPKGIFARISKALVDWGYSKGKTAFNLFSAKENNMSTAEGWQNMSQGLGLDDPRFIKNMLSLYDKSYGTSFSKMENAIIGDLEFKGDNAMNDLFQMIDEARNMGTD